MTSIKLVYKKKKRTENKLILVFLQCVIANTHDL